MYASLFVGFEKCLIKGNCMEENQVCWQCGSWFIIPPVQRSYFDSGLCGLCELKSIPSQPVEGVTLGRVTGDVVDIV